MASDDGAGIIGKGAFVKGSLSGAGDLVVAGRLEGHVAVKNHLTIEGTGKVVAEIRVGRLTVNGEASGSIDATERVSISATAAVTGNIRTPRVSIEEGARFNGSIEMDVQLPEGL